MSHNRSQDELLNEFLENLAQDINAPAPPDLDVDMIDFARRLTISEQTPLVSQQKQNQMWDQIIASQSTDVVENIYKPQTSSNGHYSHKAITPKENESGQPELLPIYQHMAKESTTHQRWSTSITRIAVAIIFILFGVSLVYLIQEDSKETAHTAPITSSDIQFTPTPDPTHQFDPVNDVMSLPPNQDQPDEIAVGESVTNSIAPSAYYVYVFNAEGGNIYTIHSVSDQRILLHHQTINRPSIGSSETASGGGGGGGGGGVDQQEYRLSGSVSVTQDAVIWLSVENTNPEIPVTYTLTLERVEFPEIEYDDVVSEPFIQAIGEINWQFEGQRGDIIDITVESNIDTSLHLQNPDGDLLISDDDSGDGLNPEIHRLQLPYEGTYRISVRPYGGYGESPTVQLSLIQHEPQQINTDETVNIFLSTKHSAGVVTFEGTAGEHVRLEAIPFDTVSFTSINVIQNEETLATMDLLPNSSGSAGGSGNSSSGDSPFLTSVSREFIIPTDGTVTIFLNTSVNIENTEYTQHASFTQVALNLTRLEEDN